MKITKVKLDKLTNDLKVVAKMGVENRPKYVIVLKDDDLIVIENKNVQRLQGVQVFVPEKQTELLIEKLHLAIETRTLGAYKAVFYKELETLLTTKLLVAEKRKARNKKEAEKITKMMNKYSRNKRGFNL